MSIIQEIFFYSQRFTRNSFNLPKPSLLKKRQNVCIQGGAKKEQYPASNDYIVAIHQLLLQKINCSVISRQKIRNNSHNSPPERV